MSRNFDGVNDNVEILNALSGYSSATLKSYSLWVKLNSSVANQIIWQSFNTSGGIFDGEGMNEQSGKFLFQAAWSGATAIWITNSAYLNDLAWHHLAVTYDNSSSSNVPVLYLDGSSVAITTSVAASGTPKGVMDSIRLCENATNAGDGNMKLAHFEVFTGVILSVNQINQLRRYPGSLGGAGGTHLLYWPLWGVSTEPDLTGNGNSGSVTGSAASTDNPPINGIFFPRRSEMAYAAIAQAAGGTTIAVPSASLTLTGKTPTILNPHTIFPDTGSLTLSAQTPTILNPRTVFPTAASLSLAAFAPKVTNGTTPAAGAKNLALLGVG